LAGGKIIKQATHPTTKAKLILISYRREPLALTPSMYDEARRLGRELTAASRAIADTRELLSIEQVRQCTNFSRAWIYSLMLHDRFPRPFVLTQPWQKRRVAWCAAAVAAWLERRTLD
jgi:predicted DNA-binding transcriptional regulator AlpA